jgi:hypothetical protein
MHLPRRLPRLAAILLLGMAVVSPGWGRWADSTQGRRATFLLTAVKNCYYDGRAFSWNACHNGQRCARGPNDFYYWEDDPTCVDIQQQGGKPQI